ncbi:hypothetical protein [Nafulsella turpanensis]|uniref:hypothetical protein n=1 Tax=Nafulsella turpanensis TaxID=1265690 RepID=UPI0012696D7B|nr:hypothetical protein [Nafulsella turpanensis]
MKLKVLLFMFGLMSATTTMAQSSLTLDASQLSSNFKFINSEGEADSEYNPTYTGAYSLGYQYATEGGFIARANVGMRNAGATMVYDDANYLWDLQYADAKLGAGYRYNPGRFSPYLIVSAYYAYLLKGNQVQGTSNHDLIKAGELQRRDYGVVVNPGVELSLSEYISVYTEFSYLMGLQNIEAKPVEGADAVQQGYNRAFALTLGLAFTITK